MERRKCFEKYRPEGQGEIPGKQEQTKKAWRRRCFEGYDARAYWRHENKESRLCPTNQHREAKH